MLRFVFALAFALALAAPARAALPENVTVTDVSYIDGVLRWQTDAPVVEVWMDNARVVVIDNGATGYAAPSRAFWAERAQLVACDQVRAEPEDAADCRAFGPFIPTLRVLVPLVQVPQASQPAQ